MRHPGLDLLDRRLGLTSRSPRLRPLSAAEVMDASASIFRRYGRMMLRLLALPALFACFAVVFVTRYVAPSFLVTRNPDSLSVQLVEAALTLGVGLFIALPLFLMSLGYASALSCRLTADALTGHVPDESQIQKSARRAIRDVVLVNLWVLVVPIGLVLAALPFLALSAWASQGQDQGWQVLAGALTVVGLTAAAMGVPIVILRSALVIPVTMVEGLRPRPALRRAVTLLHKQAPHPSAFDALVNVGVSVLIIAFIAYVGVNILLSIVDLPVIVGGWLPEGWPVESSLRSVQQLVELYAAFLVAIPLWSVAVTALYFDRRVRLEAYDISLLEQEVRRNRRESRFVL